MVKFIVQGNFINFCIAIYMFIFVLTNRSLTKEKTQKFIFASILVIILIVADSLDYYFSSFPHETIFRYITSALGYALRPMAIWFIVIIAMELNRTFTYIVRGLLICNAILAFGSIFTHCMFYFDENNEFHRGIFGFFPFVLSGFYMIILAWGVIRKFRIGNIRESAIIFLIVIMSSLGVCMETFFHFKFILDGVGNISIVFYYLFFHTQTYKRDAMTNVLNRHAFYNDIESFSKVPMIVVSVDMNNLKKINDLEGHEKGDQAIIATANGLFHQLVTGCYLYRMGGDEFAMLCLKKEKQMVEEMIQKAQKEIAELGYEIAWGIAEYKPGMNFEEIYGISDERM